MSGEIWSINNKKSLGHKAQIKRKKNNKIEYVSFTHSDITHRVKNIELQSNPDPTDKDNSHVLKKRFNGNINHLGKYQSNMKVTDPVDKSIIRRIMKHGKIK